MVHDLLEFPLACTTSHQSYNTPIQAESAYFHHSANGSALLTSGTLHLPLSPPRKNTLLRVLLPLSVLSDSFLDLLKYHLAMNLSLNILFKIVNSFPDDFFNHFFCFIFVFCTAYYLPNYVLVGQPLGFWLVKLRIFFFPLKYISQKQQNVSNLFIAIFPVPRIVFGTWQVHSSHVLNG